MKKLTFNEQYKEDEHYSSDIDRIVRVFKENGYEVSRADAKKAWEAYSDSMCAGWLYLPKDDDSLYATCWGYLENAR